MATKRILSVIFALFFLFVGVATSVAPSEAEVKQRKLIAEVELLEKRRDALVERIEKLEARCSAVEAKFSTPEVQEDE